VTAGSLSAAEHAEKTARVLSLMDAHDLDTLLLRSPAGAAWWSGGGATHIVATPEVGVAELVLTRDGDAVRTRVVTAVNEAPRLQAEELGGLDAEWTVLPWNGSSAAELPSGPRVGADVPLPGCTDVAEALTALRASLTPDEVARVEALGRDAAQALTSVCSALRPTDTEWHAAAAMAGALLERGIDPVVLLVAGGDRLPVHRHPLPTGGPLGELAMVVACGRRQGFIVSLTRFVGTPGPEGSAAFDRLLHVDAAVNLATRPGRAIGDVFADLQAAYVEHGFAADEWTLHHQGGPAGYAPRDFLGEPGRSELVAAHQLFAWNPSARGVKSEDTVLAAPEGTRIVTADPDWPTARDVRGLRRLLPLPYA
jgi:antitoxin VapB